MMSTYRRSTISTWSTRSVMVRGRNFGGRRHWLSTRRERTVIIIIEVISILTAEIVAVCWTSFWWGGDFLGRYRWVTHHDANVVNVMTGLEKTDVRFQEDNDES